MKFSYVTNRANKIEEVVRINILAEREGYISKVSIVDLEQEPIPYLGM